MALSLRPMSPAEFDGWYPEQEQHYVAERVQAGEPEDVARGRAASEFAVVFPHRRPGPRQELFVLDDDRPVGVVWVGRTGVARTT